MSFLSMFWDGAHARLAATAPEHREHGAGCPTPQGEAPRQFFAMWPSKLFGFYFWDILDSDSADGGGEKAGGGHGQYLPGV